MCLTSLIILKCSNCTVFQSTVLLQSNVQALYNMLNNDCDVVYGCMYVLVFVSGVRSNGVCVHVCVCVLVMITLLVWW